MQNNKEIKVFVIFLPAAHLMLGPCVISGAAAPTTGLTLGMFGVLWGIFKLKSFWTTGNDCEFLFLFFYLINNYFLSGAPANTAATTGFSLAFNKPTASATPFSLTATSTSSTAAAGTGLTFGSVLTSTAPQQPTATGFALGLGGATTTTTAALTGPSLGSSLFSSTVPTGERQTVSFTELMC